MNELPTIDVANDKRTWTREISGELSTKSVVNLTRTHYPTCSWVKYVRFNGLHRTTASNIWKIVRRVCATDEDVKNKGVNLASRCCFCGVAEETITHLLSFCNFSEII